MSRNGNWRGLGVISQSYIMDREFLKRAPASLLLLRKTSRPNPKAPFHRSDLQLDLRSVSRLHSGDPLGSSSAVELLSRRLNSGSLSFPRVAVTPATSAYRCRRFFFPGTYLPFSSLFSVDTRVPTSCPASLPVNSRDFFSGGLSRVFRRQFLPLSGKYP